MPRLFATAAVLGISLIASCETSDPPTSGRLNQVLENAYRPTAPNLTSLTPGNAELTAHFTPGDGGAYSIIEYAISCTPVPGDSTMAKSKVAPDSPITVSGLTNGVSYSCRGQSRSAGGLSDRSNALTATPVAPSGN